MHVAVVEDDASVRDLLSEWINLSSGFRCVAEYANAESAIAHLPAQKPAIVLVDINLPGLSGIECVRRLKPQMQSTQFVMLTVYEDSNHIFDALAAGAIGYLLKPTPCSTLIASLKQISSGGSPMTGYIARKVVQSFQSAGQLKAEVDDLSPREREVLELLARGYFYKEIAESLGVKISTVNSFICNIYHKLHVHSRARALAKLKGSQTVLLAPADNNTKKIGS